MTKDTEMKFVYTFDKHKNEPEKALDSYVKEKKIELGSWINNRKKVYLDTKFWLLLRDGYLGRVRSKDQSDLLHVLQSGVDKGTLICPISYDVFAEVIKQTDEVSLKATVKLIDELSLGVSLVSEDERRQIEALHFVRSYMLPSTCLHDVKDFVWTKVAYTHGMQVPHNNILSEAENRLIQKAFLDQMWSISLLDLIEVIGLQRLLNYPHTPDLSGLLNQEKDAYLVEYATFRTVFLTELAYILQREETTFDKMVLYLFEKEYGHAPRQEEVSSASAGYKFRNLIHAAFKQEKVGKKLPTFEIEAGIHAQLIYDRTRKYKPNDVHDISHAISALPYCDYFFTEKNLRELVIKKNLGYDKKYDCAVVSSVRNAISVIEDTSVADDSLPVRRTNRAG
jgi:hypothetical protein